MTKEEMLEKFPVGQVFATRDSNAAPFNEGNTFVIEAVTEHRVVYRYLGGNRSARNKLIDVMLHALNIGTITRILGHDFSNPYLAPRGKVRCARCAGIWDIGAPPTVAYACACVDPGLMTPMQVAVDKVAANGTPFDSWRIAGLERRQQEPRLLRPIPRIPGTHFDAVFSSWNGRAPR